MRMKDGGSVKVGVISCCLRSDRTGVILVATCTVQNQVKNYLVKIGSGPQIGKFLDVHANLSKIDPSNKLITMEHTMQKAGSTPWIGPNHSREQGVCHT